MSANYGPMRPKRKSFSKALKELQRLSQELKILIEKTVTAQTFSALKILIRTADKCAADICMTNSLSLNPCASAKTALTMSF